MPALFDRFPSIPWSRLLLAPVGIQLAVLILMFCVLVASLAVLGRWLEALRPPPKPESKRTKRGWGLKAFLLLLIAIAPGGLAAAAGAAAGMGKAHWRRDAAALVATSLALALLLAWHVSPYFPAPHASENLFFSAVLGLAFGLLQLWALVKLLREYWGEPPSKVPLRPPLALGLQILLLALGMVWIVLGEVGHSR